MRRHHGRPGIRRLGTAVAAAAILSLALSACSGSTDAAVDDESSAFGFHHTSLPLVEKSLTPSIAGEKALLAPDYNEMSLVQQWQEDPNIEVEWNLLAPDVY